ncbi:MAG: TonB-dependent receptor plug domain-containing protein, partial [Gemmatimonadota bacterium]
MFDHRQRVVIVEPCQMHFRYRIATAALASVFAISGASAQQIPTTQDTIKLPEIAVFGSRAELQELRQDLRLQPGSVNLIEPAALRATRQANLKDVLRMIPGVYVAPRFGAADEAQISIRGSGLRNNFHARGLNLLINGMPYRNSDGFTDFEAIELMTVDAMTVYKGGNAFRFGGGTLGGAINMQTKTGYSADRVDLTAEGGANGLFKGQLSSGGTAGKLDWYGSYTRTSLDGYRAWSDQGRDRVNAHLGYLISPTTDIRAFYLFAHVREHLPGAL